MDPLQGNNVCKTHRGFFSLPFSIFLQIAHEQSWCFFISISMLWVLFQELSSKDQEKVAEVSRVRVELQEQIGHLQAERTAQGGLKEKINALEREIKGQPSLFHSFLSFSQHSALLIALQEFHIAFLSFTLFTLTLNF